MRTPKSSSSRAYAALPTKLLELQMAAPQVVAHRLARMATAGPVLSQRDRREFTGMVTEKQTAFFQSWWAMGMEVQRLQWEFMLGGMRTLWAPAGANPMAAWWNLPTQWQQAAGRVAMQGLQPVHRKATANARRLNRTKR